MKIYSIKRFVMAAAALFFLGLVCCGYASSEPAGGFEKGIHAFLSRQSDNPMGIPASFINSADPALSGQASTYDLALAGLGFLRMGDYRSAGGILRFLERKWDEQGFCNFYDTKTGSCGLEHTVHLGPNMWAAILALRYSADTGNKEFYPLAKKIALWATRLEHRDGGISMGPFKDWGADWTRVYSAENNIVAYAVFRAIYNTESKREAKILFDMEMQGIRQFINANIIFRDEDGSIVNISAGYNPGEERSDVSACDVVSMLLLVFNSQELQQYFSLKRKQLVDFADKNFLVYEDGIHGFDFTDQASCFSIARPRMVSLEWTMQMACALQHGDDQAPNSKGGIGAALSGQPDKSDFFAGEVDKKRITFEGMYFYPYAGKDFLQVFPFACWWKTPLGDTRKCGAMSSTVWRLFQYKKFNPLRGGSFHFQDEELRPH